MTDNRYLNLYVNFLEKRANVRKPLKVVFDCSNGPAGLVLKKLKIANCKLKIINADIDSRFPAHGPNPLLPHALTDVKREVKKQKANLGVVFDADADRAVFVDNLGREMPFYTTIFLLSLVSQPPYAGDVYVAKTMEHLGILKIIASPVGTYHMKQTIKKSHASLGGEISGHYYFREMRNADSGILAAIKALNALSATPYTAAQFADVLPNFYFRQWNISASDVNKLMVRTKSAYGRRTRKTSRLDGFLFDFKNWFLIVRPSNTEPVVRFFLGSKNKKVFQKELKSLLSLLQTLS